MTLVATLSYRVIIEPDEGRWFAYCPALEDRGAATWGYTFQETLAHIQEVVQMVVEEMTWDGEVLPRDPEADYA
jgi:predicted RNase H-like HicB family nuclease